ncbi:MAG: aldehyde dehydrogenase [Pseudomonadota bacterium]|nr:aldehyde dehydrogenase [Pseudomonadota bacterium]
MAAYTVKLRVGSEDRDGGSTFDRVGPVTGDVATSAAAASAQDAIDACDAAAAAFPEWSSLGPNARRSLLLKAADILESKAAKFSEVVMAETGATKGWGGFNAKLATEMIRDAAALTTRMTGETIPADRPGTVSMSFRTPVGVVVGIAPWNAPVILGTRAIALPLACGNTVVLKGSEACPMTHRMIVDAFLEAGIPDGVCNYICNDEADAPEVVKALVHHPAVRRVNFTGSTKVGKIIAKLAADGLKPALLELGGKSPLVILDDANLDEAVNAAVFGAFMNQGQICMSTERIIVQKSVADEFVSKFQARVSALKTGRPEDEGTQIGGLVDLRTVEHVNELVDDGQSHGADIVLRGTADGAVMSPSIVNQVTQSMKIWSDESFGPVVCIAHAEDDEHAIELANDTEYGLSASVYASDINRAMNVAQKIESGICHINGPTVFDEAQMPFGGVKSSGYGRFGGVYGINEFTDIRWVTINRGPIHYPI